MAGRRRHALDRLLGRVGGQSMGGQVVERRAILEQGLEAKGKDLDVLAGQLGTLPDFMEEFFFRKHGIGKLAKKELRRFVHSIKHYYK